MICEECKRRRRYMTADPELYRGSDWRCLGCRTRSAEARAEKTERIAKQEAERADRNFEALQKAERELALRVDHGKKLRALQLKHRVLERERDEARTDTERLDFLIEKQACVVLDERVPTYIVEWEDEEGCIVEERRADYREAIDAARESGGEEG